MSIIEIRCPRCGSSPSFKDFVTNKYYCGYCRSSFVFLDATKNAAVNDIKAHYCPFCGRSISQDGCECTECGTQHICQDCTSVMRINGFDKTICINCLNKSRSLCSICRKSYVKTCRACGQNFCQDHVQRAFEISHEREDDPFQKIYAGNEEDAATTFTLFCHGCHGDICLDCYEERSSFWRSGKEYFCRRCGTKLILKPAYPIPA